MGGEECVSPQEIHAYGKEAENFDLLHSRMEAAFYLARWSGPRLGDCWQSWVLVEASGPHVAWRPRVTCPLDEGARASPLGPLEQALPS